MKKALVVLIAALLLAVLCSCSGVSVSIDRTGESSRCGFGLMYEGRDGNVYSDDPQGYYDAGTELTAHANSVDGKAFYCWTLGGYLSSGGTVVSYDKDYTFAITGDTLLYANFRDRDAARVLYYTNGGSVCETGAEYLWQDFSLDYYLYPNTLPDMGYFEREGYVLIGYNTEPDNTGTYYNVGGKAFEDTDSVIELYCIWAEESPDRDFEFEYNYAYKGWFVNGYTGDGDVVCIPASYEDEPVRGVYAGAFSGNEDITGLIFPSSIRIIQDNSCDNMVNLYSVLLYDSLEYVSDQSFDGDTNLTLAFFSAATNPKFSTWFNNHTKKIEIMNYWKDTTPKMIILGGSSTTYAVDPELLQESIDRDYLVLNCGSNGANLFNMTSEWAMHFLNEGDFLLQIPEYSFWQLGGVECRWESFRSFESCYNIFSWITVHKYTEFFNSFNEYLDARRDMADKTYEDYTSTLAPDGYYNIQGKLNVVTKANGSADFWSGRNILFSDAWLYDFMVYYCNVQYWKLDQLGVDYAMAFTPLNRNSLYDYQTDEGMVDFVEYLDQWLNIDIVSDADDIIWEPEVFFDDDYHLAAPAREEYTLNLASDLNAYFASLDSDSIEE